MLKETLLISFIILYTSCDIVNSVTPIVISTWRFSEATTNGWLELVQGRTALDAVEVGASTCEFLRCDGTVGYGGSPDERSETTLDALIMDGNSMNVGAVGAMRNIKRAMSVARKVLKHTSHSLLVGESATKFAESMGFKQESLTTPESKKLWIDWWKNKCQPNFWQDVSPDPKTSCGPYSATGRYNQPSARHIDEHNHDTIGIIAIDYLDDIAAGTSTNGAKFKIPGRVGDSPIPGSGAYADNTVGAAVSTGDGDVMLRFCPSFLAVEEMRRGYLPSTAAATAVKRIASHYPHFMGAVIAVYKDGTYGAACHGIHKFPFTVHDSSANTTVTKYVDCIA